MSELVSVLMSTYNEPEHFLRQSIESVLSQSHTLFEYIIVLDNPENTTIKRVVNEYAENDDRIVIVENEKNLGLTNSLNKALAYCKGKYIARMDADDISDFDRLENQLDYIKKHDYDLIGSKVRRIDENGSIVQLSSNHPVSHAVINRVLRFDNCVPHPTWFARKEVYTELNGYRDIHTCEDYDFLLRCKKKFRIGNFHGVTVSYRLTSESISRSNALKQLLSADYLQKNYKKIDRVTQKEIDKYVKKRMIFNMETNFDKAQLYFKEAMMYKEKGETFKMAVKILAALNSSQYFGVRCKNMLLGRLAKIDRPEYLSTVSKINSRVRQKSKQKNQQESQ